MTLQKLSVFRHRWGDKSVVQRMRLVRNCWRAGIAHFDLQLIDNFYSRYATFRGAENKFVKHADHLNGWL